MVAAQAPTCDPEDDPNASTIIKRHTGKQSASTPSVEIVKLDYDEELTQMQTCIDDKNARVAHESKRNKEAHQELGNALDDFISKTKSA